MNRTHGLLFVILTVALATSAARAGETVDLDAEAKQAAQEEEEQKAERLKGATGKYQRTFYGTFRWLNNSADPNAPQMSPEVVGTLVTNASDRKPDRSYLVKAENGNKGIIETLKKYDGKVLEIQGKLRNINAEGEAKYLIVSTVIEVAPTRPATERRKLGGL